MSGDRGGDSPWPGAVLFLVAMVSGLTWLLTGTYYYDAKQNEAVKEGHAVWVQNEQGRPQFKWLPRCAQAQPAKESEKK